MRKQELIHLHGLLVEIRRYVAAQEEMQIPAGAFDAYDALGIGPTAVAEGKEAHKEAVDRLFYGLQKAMTAQQCDSAKTPSAAGDLPSAR